ncbi:hypothetical protein GJ629_05940 [Halapricum sp. CBA1109]|uniref:hypothetical protein n=1 Tax=Halapricum sp. CBA1109 TaxID=2668068 RepID=UPI0012FA4C15|nr:hypothetical protein [Halapricum sp. CBA1109]MUV89491.1 hypothetical protein [Halapricum sp. CBA1109]
MRTSTPSAFDSDLLQSVYEVRSLIVIGFVLVTALAHELGEMGMEVAASVLFVATLPLLAVVAIGGCREGLSWLSERVA